MDGTHTHKIKVGIFADGLGRKGKGTAIVLQRIVEHLYQMPNFNIRLIYLAGQCNHELCRRAPSVEVRLFQFPQFSGFFSYAYFFLFSKERFDIVHFPRPALHPLFWLIKALGRTQKIVVAFHGAPESRDIPIFKTWQTRFNRRFIAVFGKYFIDAGIVLSESARDPVARYYHLHNHKIVVINTGVDVQFSNIQHHILNDADKQYLQARYNIPYPYILSVGRLDPHKNIHRLIEGYAKARNKHGISHTLVIVGGKHEPTYTQRVERTIDDLGMRNSVCFTSFVEDKDLPLVYRGADAFLFVSLSEGFGMPLIEAMASGCPVLTSNISAMPEIAGGAAHLVNPYDTDEIAEGIRKLLRDMPLRTELVQKGLIRSRDFSWKRCAEETQGLYMKLYTNKDL